MHVSHLFDGRDAKAHRDRKRRELAHARNEILGFGADSFTRAGDSGARDSVDETTRVFGDELQTFVGGRRRDEEDHVEVVSTQFSLEFARFFRREIGDQNAVDSGPSRGFGQALHAELEQRIEVAEENDRRVDLRARSSDHVEQIF